MATKKSSEHPSARKNKSSIQWQPILLAALPVIGSVIAAYFAFRGAIATTLIPIEVTQTAEAKSSLLTQAAPTQTPVPPTPTLPAPTSTANVLQPDVTQIINQMVRVESGSFLMGSSESKDSDSNYVHEVELNTYWIDKYEVTNADYQIFLDQTHLTPPGSWIHGNYPLGRDKYPVVDVSWYDAKAFCEFTRKRLPSEAEWEKAARGSDQRKWPWGNTWNVKNTNTAEGRVGDLRPVGSYDSGTSPYGAYDMAGNVWEWVNDWYEADFYKSSPKMDPLGPPFGDFKVLRGGSWSDIATLSQSFVRLGVFPIDYTSGNVGFRCVCSACNP